MNKDSGNDLPRLILMILSQLVTIQQVVVGKMGLAVVERIVVVKAEIPVAPDSVLLLYRLTVVDLIAGGTLDRVVVEMLPVLGLVELLGEEVR